MAFDLARLRKVFDPSKETPPDDPYKYRTPPFVPEDPRTMPQVSLNNAFAGPGSADLYPNSYLNAGRQTQPQQQVTSSGLANVGQEMSQPIQMPNPGASSQSKLPQPINAPTGGVGLQTQIPLPDVYDQAMSEDFKEVPYRTPPGRATPAYDAYKKGIEEMPQMNKPGPFRRIAAAALGGMTGSPQNAEFVVHKPYYDAMAPWQAKMPHLQNAATQERQIQTQEDRDAYNDLIAQWRFENLARQTQEGQQRIGIAQQNANTSSFRAGATARYQEESNRIKAEALQGGQIVYNKMTGAAYLKKGNGELEAIPSEILQGYSFEDELQLRNAGRLLIVDTQAEYARQLQADRDREAAARQKEALEAKANEAKTQSDADKKVGLYLRAQKVYNENPDLQEVIILGDPGSNAFRIEAPPDTAVNRNIPFDLTGYQRLTAAAKRANELIYGTETPTAPAPAPGQKPTPPAPAIPRGDVKVNPGSQFGGGRQIPAPSQDFIEVINPQGQRKRIRFSDWPEAEKQGYKKAPLGTK